MKSENIFNKNENKLYTFLGGFLGFIIATVLYFFAAQNNIRHIIVMFLGVGIIDIGVIFGNFFGKKRKEKAKKLNEDLKIGKKIITIGGIYGVINKIEENTVEIKVDDNTNIKFSKNAISKVLD